MTKSNYYYHVTQKKWPNKIILSPKIKGDHRSPDEPLIARTCVSPTIEGCLVALGYCLSLRKKVYIYRTENKVLAENPYNVFDSYITKEKWLIKPIKFKKIGILNNKFPEEIRWLQVGGIDNLDMQVKYLFKLKKMKLNFVDWT